MDRRDGELERWRAGELESWRAGELVDIQRRRTISLLAAEPARRPATMVKTRWEAATACSTGLLSIFGAG